MTAVFLGTGTALFSGLLHAGVARWLPARLYIRATFYCLLAGLAACALLAAMNGWVLDVGQWLLTAILAASLVLAYALLFVGIAWDSPTLALVNVILDHGPAGMPAAALEAFIQKHPFVQSRLNAMLQAGALADDGERFVVRRDMGLAMRVAEAYRRLCCQSDGAG